MSNAEPTRLKKPFHFPLPAGARPRPVSHYHVALVLLAVLPLVVAFGVLAWWQSLALRQSIDSGMLRSAQALSLAVDREVGIIRAKLETLAGSEAIDRQDMAELYREAYHAAADRPGSWIAVTDRSGQQLINTLLPFGTRLPNTFDTAAERSSPNTLPLSATAYIRNVFANGRPNNSHVFMSILGGMPVVAMNVPVIRRGQTNYVVSMTMPPRDFAGLLSAVRFEQGSSAALVDGNGFVITRTQEPERFIGHKAASSLAIPSGGSDEGFGSGTTLGGEVIFRAYVRSRVTGWIVSVGVLQSTLEHDIMTGLLRTVLAGLAGLVLSILLALRVSYRLGAPIIALAAKSSGKPVLLPDTGLVSAEVVELSRAIEAGNLAQEAAAKERERRVAAEARKEEADAANRAKDQFLAMLGHELRNPLAAIANAASVMERQTQFSPSMNAIVKRQSEHLRKLVDDLLDVARVTSGKIRLLLESVDLYEVAESCVQNFLRTGRSTSHALTVSGESVFVFADPHRMTQVLTNLLDNALKFTPAGGRIAVSVNAEGDDAVLRVADTGCGIPPEGLSRIFEVFAQGDQALDRAHGGLGLGLALAKSLVEMHRGSIAAASEGEDRGTTFTIRLPRVQRGTPAAEREEQRRQPLATQQRRVLIVEDQDDTRQALRSLLELAGHQVWESADGKSAVDTARSTPIDVAFVDLGLPEMDGFDVARIFSNDAGLCNVRLIALTGYSRPEDREKAREAGFHHFIIKPLEEQTLRRVLATDDVTR